MPLVEDAYEVMRDYSRLQDTIHVNNNCDYPIWLRKVCQLDSLCHATITIPSARKSSLSQGRCMMKVCTEIFDEKDSKVFGLLMQKSIRFDDFIFPSSSSSSSSSKQFIHRNLSITISASTRASELINSVQPPTTITLTEKECEPAVTTSITSSSNCSNNNSYLPNPVNTTYRGHYAPFFGVVCGQLGLSKELTQTMFLRCMMRDALSAAYRLNILGPLQAAKLQLYFSRILPTMLPATTTTDSNPTSISTSNILSKSVAYNRNSTTMGEEADNTDENIGKRKREQGESDEDSNSKKVSNTTNHNNKSLLVGGVRGVSEDIQEDAIKAHHMTHHQRHWAAEDLSLPYLSPRAVDVLMKRRMLQTEIPLATACTATAPVLDLIQSQHDQLYSRLFIS